MQNDGRWHIKDEVGGFCVSTVDLGRPYLSPPPGESGSFESLVFDADGTDIHCRIYPDQEGAEAGHAELMALFGGGWTNADA